AMSNNGWVGPWRPHRPRGPISALYRTPGPKYELPTNVGYVQHDPSRSRAPAYTFGLRVGTNMGSCSPGPRYLVPPGFTEKGRSYNPAYSITGRPRAERVTVYPGPGECGARSSGRAGDPRALPEAHP
ncbi:ODF3A protein, partial [Neodrepanis coruscans]|nr:ODF3A protein [Neodrepanis coruscans]